MNTFTIKVIAVGLMVIDHVGVFFFPDISLLRIIGRGAFPLFAWLIANGVYHTSNINNYLNRLLFFAVISQVPYLLANRQIDFFFTQYNVLFTLFLGLLTIKI